MSWTNFTKRASEVRTFTFDFRRKLLADEVLTGTPTVEEFGSSDLTITGVGLTVSPTLQIGKIFTATDQGVVFTVAGGTAGTTYTIRITTVTNVAVPQTLIQDVTLRVI